jgi:hypothetical protein
MGVVVKEYGRVTQNFPISATAEGGLAKDNTVPSPHVYPAARCVAAAVLNAQLLRGLTVTALVLTIATPPTVTVTVTVPLLTMIPDQVLPVPDELTVVFWPSWNCQLENVGVPTVLLAVQVIVDPRTSVLGLQVSVASGVGATRFCEAVPPMSVTLDTTYAVTILAAHTTTPIV